MADVGAFSSHLCEVALQLRLKHLSAHKAREEAVCESPFDFPGYAADTTFPIAPHRALHDLQTAVGPRARFVTDIGEHMLFALHYLTTREAQGFGIHLGLGSMGSGIGSAVGRALADPSRTVVCICGDGGMQMSGAEILVAVKHKLPVLFAVFNDSRYNMVYHGYRQQFGRTAAWSTPTINFVAWAQGHGVPARRVNRPGEITPALVEQLMRRPGPALLDIRHNANVRIKGAGRVEALQQMSGRGGSE
ncbi:thiamine pyrophosphate-dependent enzyme [Streptomyces albireticuli]|uniref:Thiamine pyrophosphate enzyme TPP-binding domain-containing protein n=1 Tax=Streptomyces albireticuli TaxID=1940 RepID=A0A2A2D0Y6_9ACTN|nr:thiamine pyrophosphate-dependent enzyme [Streptomyces albireticuli]MCD9145727.1 thiamine pyrophosphate-dependent enzyme [Streptomyces albireticuli]MCD9165541.1 thiamine pyrophosphate-dependent enzyme [Streptomyces albireticuli]MCD9195936.1 thiamine pyrophosphate-dependent enzyme [Streptomyces albireticuli]PAU45174.1 hypothetical protein CK936_30925 [Streptomyces albireticuli]